MQELYNVYHGQTPTHSEALHHTYLYHISSLDSAYSLEVWKASLAGSKPCMFPRLTARDEQTPTSQRFTLQVTRQALEALDIEPAVVLQLAWALVLRGFVGVDSVTFGYQFNGRDRKVLSGIDQAVGSFASVLPLSVDLAPGQSLEACLDAMKESFDSAWKHQNLTMAEIQHAIGRKDPLFNTCLYLDDTQHSTPTSLITSSRQTDSSLSLTASFISDILHVNLSSRLSPNQAQSVVSSFEKALVNMLSRPSSLVADIDLFNGRDYAQLAVHDWETTQRSGAMDACLHDVIFQHDPESQAVCSWDGDLTYLQLATLVTRLRTYLVNLGVGPGMAVPVVLDKNRFAPIMLLAVLQAGAAFVALDAQDQTTALATIKYLNPPIILASESAWKDLNTVVLNLVIVNNAFFAMLPPQMSCLSREASPDHAACVFITPRKSSSGSSRSIFFTHASLCSVFIAQGSALNLDTDSRVFQLSAFNVDVSLVEVLGTLTNGGCVCIPSAKDRTRGLAGVMSRMGVTWSYMTSILARRIKPESVPTLKTLCFRTRRLDPDTYAPWLADRTILLAYGAPDVCPLGISISQILEQRDLSIIHPPLSGRFWILNPEDPQKLMPVGAMGELAIDSPLVIPHRFALDKPLTAPRTDTRSRHLKTGHRVRYLDNGNIQFLSSVRDEVTIDGARIDVADVEQHIRRCLGQGVDVIVDTITTRDSLPLLVTFLELGPTLFHDQEDLFNVSARVKERTFIAKRLFQDSLENPLPQTPRLAEQCIPSVFVPLREIPLSTSLKVNRRKLQRMAAELTYAQLVDLSTVPNPAETQRVILSLKPLPLTHPEEVMQVMWARVLGISPSDIRGSSTFFSVGGDRFLAAELVIECRKASIRLSLTDIFKEATLTEICRADGQRSRKNPARPSKRRIISPIAGIDSDVINEIVAPKLSCSPHDVLDMIEATSQQTRALELGIFTPRADITSLVLTFNGPLNTSRLESACQLLTRTHPILRTAFVSHEDHVYQVLNSTFKPTFQRLPCPGGHVESMAEKLITKSETLPFDISVPLTLFTFLDAGQHSKLIIRLGRAQVDEASVPLLVNDLKTLYEDPNVDLSSSSFFEYARVTGANADQATSYWTNLLEGSSMTQILSHTSPPSPCPASQIKSLQESVSLGPLLGYGMAHDTALKAAWATVLATISGTPDIVFGETIPARNTPIDNVVGPLTNTIPVRVPFPSQHSTPLDLMRYIRYQRQSNTRFDTLGFQKIVTKCTNWTSWTQFSTVVHSETASLDASSTRNMGNTTFTCQTVQTSVQDMPDMLVSSTLEASDRVTLQVKYPESRVSATLAESCLRLLVAAWETLTHPDTIAQPMLQSAEEIERSDKGIPIAVPEPAVSRTPIDSLLVSSQRISIQAAIESAWGEAIKPGQNHLHTSPFYEITSSLLSARPLTSSLNRSIQSLDLKGLDTPTLSVQDIISHPTMLSQLELIALRLRESGSLTLPIRRKTTNPGSGT